MFVDLGMSPLCQTHIAPEQLNSMEPFYPLHVYVCGKCFLVQLEEFVAPADIFTRLRLLLVLLRQLGRARAPLYARRCAAASAWARAAW